jgi:ABC-type Na+ transport system ATPase subunit NatA
MLCRRKQGTTIFFCSHELPEVPAMCDWIFMTNFVGTLLVDGVGVGLAAFGLLNPLLAAFIHVSSELAFILNSARLLARPGRSPL